MIVAPNSPSARAQVSTARRAGRQGQRHGNAPEGAPAAVAQRGRGVLQTAIHGQEAGARGAHVEGQATKSWAITTAAVLNERCSPARFSSGASSPGVRKPAAAPRRPRPAAPRSAGPRRYPAGACRGSCRAPADKRPGCRSSTSTRVIAVVSRLSGAPAGGTWPRLASSVPGGVCRNSAASGTATNSARMAARIAIARRPRAGPRRTRRRVWLESEAMP